MLKTAAIILVLSDLCLAIRVPTTWESDSEVQNDPQPLSSLDTVSVNKQQVIPAEYFVYTAEKPEFAAEIAAFHGVQNPKSHYKAYPIRPYTGKQKPQLGKHQILDENKSVFQQYRDYTKKGETLKSHGTPVSVDYEVFHPYKAEEPALQQIYKDPVLTKIRDDIRDSQHRLQNYENEAGKPDISGNEYLESPEQIDRKKFPQRNVPAPYELHRPQRKPVYYRPVPKHSNREHVLNQRFRHPWNQNFVKIRPAHYIPLRNHIGHLRQHHAVKFDDERNEYPQLPPAQVYADPIDGYDIYEKRKQKYVQLRNNVDESINQAVKENKPIITQKLELQNNEDKTETQIIDDDEEEFVPVKNYAQVRKTETTKHLPREAAFDDADSFDEIGNAPRLREAIKSTKAQTVYTEEGYEDAAYDHAGEQKHASENEGHAGYLKEKEISGGKFKEPSISAKFEDAIGKAYQDQTLHGEQWQNSNKDQEEESDVEDYSEDDTERSIEADIYQDVNGERSKREKSSGDYTDNEVESNSKKLKIGNNKTDDSENNYNNGFDQNKTQFEESQHEVNKRETNFKIPEINLNSTFLTEKELLKIAKLKLEPKKENIKDKYPYYFKNLKSIHKHSPLRYAENLKLIPRKSNGGTEFYDSRSQFECPEVDEKVDAIPDKLKKKGHPDDDEDETSGEDELKQKMRGEADFDSIKDNPRLKGLGDKIDCFKAKYFGENPLDSPFFKEEIIANPEPVTVPNLAAYTLTPKELFTQESKDNNVLNLSKYLKEGTVSNGTDLLDKLKVGQKELQESLVKTNQELRSSLRPQNISNLSNSELSQHSNVYSDILNNIKAIIEKPILTQSIFSSKAVISNTNSTSPSNLTYYVFKNNENSTQLPTVLRKKRATPFVYEPYKIIRDSHVQDSRKTTTTSNISPLIKQLQSSKVVDRVTKVSQDKEQPVKRNVATRTYKDIGRKDREKSVSKEVEELSNASFEDVNKDGRRGEPRYELRRGNHKSQYTPVENKKAMSLDDYQARTNKTEKKTNETEENGKIEQQTIIPIQRLRSRKPAVKPYFDVSQFLPQFQENQKPAASNKVNKIVKVATRHPDKEIRQQSISKLKEKKENTDDEEDYDEYDDDEEIVTTTTTSRPSFRRRRTRTTSTTTSTTTTTTTTVKPHKEEEIELELPKLRLITRFRNSHPNTKNEKNKPRELPLKKLQDDHESEAPKYREKKKKTEKSTLVTDTKTYNDGDADGDEEDNIRKKEVDDLIGVKQDMDEYTPSYERKIHLKSNERDKEGSESSEEDNDDDDDDDDEDFDQEDDDDDEDYNDDDDDDEEEPEPPTTTPEPTKRTLARTTEAPISTTEARSAKLETKPSIMKKKLEVHKELPINRTSPHVTQFKQDIKEIEIIKEIPTKFSHRKPPKNLEALELYKDDKLAKEVNKLDAVEIFKQNLDLRKGPRHGGNYRSEKLIELQEETISTPQPLHGGNLKVAKEDTETSQSENSKLVELSDVISTRSVHGSNFKLIDDVKRSKPSNRNAKLELSDTTEEISTRNMHGGNLRPIDAKSRRRGREKSAKLIEFDDERDDDEDSTTRRMHGGNFKSYSSRDDDRGGTHGGNYRNAKIVQADNNEDEKEENNKSEINATSKAAVLLNSFAQAVPILTTTPAYILDPSKRMYYYVED